MSADVIPADDTAAVVETLTALIRDVRSGHIRALSLVAVLRDGGFVPVWHASHALGPHAGSILRGAVCWLSAEMDAKARSE